MFLLGLLTAVRVLVLIALASLIWVPIGVWIGLRPRSPTGSSRSCSSSPPSRPICSSRSAVVLILRFQLNPEIWLSPLMILGTQWYILFNVIGGAAGVAGGTAAARRSNFGVRRLAVVAAGDAAGDLSGLCHRRGHCCGRLVERQPSSPRSSQWGDTTLTATGIGAYIAQTTANGDFARIALGIGVLCLYVLAFNRLLWRRLYDLAAERLRLD